MRKNTTEYRDWKKFQDEKNLRKRAERKKSNKRKGQKRSNTKKRQPDKIFIVPDIFSIVSNPDTTITFLNKVIRSVEGVRNLQRQHRNNYIRTFLIDMSNTKYISSDALMFLLTIIQNTRGKKILPIDWIGNFPKEPDVREFLKRSGYLNYMKTSTENIIQVDDNIQIKSGTGYNYIENDQNKDIRQEIIDFSCQKLNKDKKDINYLMTMLTEMITNIIDHAYQKQGLFKHQWYIFVDNNIDKITYTFMDNGLGIPTTIRKSIIEKIIETINAEAEYKYIETALSGVHKRSETGKRERGNGLPSIYEQYLNKKIENFVIISNKAYYSENKKYDLKEGLNGTVFYWEIKKEGK